MKKFHFIFMLMLTAIFPRAQWVAVADGAEHNTPKLSHERLYQLNRELLLDQISKYTSGVNAVKSTVVIPNLKGELEKFEIQYSPVIDEHLAKRYQLASYSGRSLNNPARKIRLSVAPGSISGTIFQGDELQFVEKVYGELYSVHPKSSARKGVFVCGTEEPISSQAGLNRMVQAAKTANALSARVSDRKFRTLRLAISVTAEYTNYFGGVPQAMAAIHHTLTRVNGIFERDLAVQLILQDFPQLIFTDPKTDPYSDYTTGANGAWSAELQNTLTNTIGNSAYDLGHLFGANGGGGNAGKVGLVCQDDSADTGDLNKGAAFTSPANGKPEGDTFDIDFVAHEMGHQLGATHTFSYILEKQGTSVEPGSGSTIMGYAGITTADVQQHSDSYFHAVSIDQIKARMQVVSCDKEISVGNHPPVIQPLASFTIPKSTPFVLTAAATDAENDPITYTWEQMDDAKTPVTVVTGHETSGPIFRSMPPTLSPSRYFPKLSRVLEGTLSNPADWETVSHVPRVLNFAVTVRDNSPLKQQQQTSSATQMITVGNDGPFKVITSQIYTNAATPVIWDNANTAAAPYHVSDVKIDYSLDDGSTWNILTPSTPNDGSEYISIPGLVSGTEGYIRISALNNVFYAVGRVSAAAAQPCDGSAPSVVQVREITANSALVTWTMVTGATYKVRYRAGQNDTWQQVTVNSNYIPLSALKDGTLYEVQVAAVCSGTDGTFSSVSQFATLSALKYCTVMAESASEEYISRVSLAEMTNDSGASTYSDFTSNSEQLIKLKPAGSYQLSVAFKAKNTTSNEAVKAWTDFNANGIFEDEEVIMKPVLTTQSTVVASFTVPQNAALGKVLRMRVALRYNNVAIAPCTGYDYGEIEDYAVVITGNANDDFMAEGIVLYPIPAVDYLRISNITAVGSYQIYDMSGRLIRSGETSGTQIYVGDLAPAAYIINFAADNEKIRRKFIKN